MMTVNFTPGSVIKESCRYTAFVRQGSTSTIHTFPTYRILFFHTCLFQNRNGDVTKNY